jgi:predicted nucleic acid-binding protein
MRIVLDTNVLVSGLLASGTIVLCHDARILAEYEEVLRRAKFAFPEDAVAALLDQIRDEGHSVVGVPLTEELPDADDEAFLEVALAGSAEALVTGNSKHYPEQSRQGMSVLTPKEFLDQFKERAVSREPVDRDDQ